MKRKEYNIIHKKHLSSFLVQTVYSRNSKINYGVFKYSDVVIAKIRTEDGQ